MFFLDYLLILITTPLLCEGRIFAQQSPECGPIEISRPSGVITSPGYPQNYPEHISCTWLFFYPEFTELTIRITDLDIEQDSVCPIPPCCSHNWLSISNTQLCGHNITVPEYVTSRQMTTVKFHSSKTLEGGRGFRLAYFMCQRNEFRCANNAGCIDKMLKCDGIKQCEDGSDEVDCLEMFKSKLMLEACGGENMVPCGGSDTVCYNNATAKCNGIADCPNTGNDEKFCGPCGPNMLYCKTGGCYPHWGWCDTIVQCANGWDEGVRAGCGSCRPDYVSCGPPDNCHCFNPRTQRCDGQMDCPHGEDEISCVSGCDNEIACASVEGCYSPAERCDGIPHCADHSDEVGCFTQTTDNKFRCTTTGRCIDDLYLCNGDDDCGDGSDEDNCVKNSIITAVIMGALACGMIAVFGAAIGWRYYTSRCNLMPVISVNNYQRQLDQGPMDEATLYHLYREPPPSYHEAMQQGASTPTYCHPTRFMNMTSRSGDNNIPVAMPRRQRPSRTIRPRSARPLPKPPQVIKPAEESSNVPATSHIIAGDQLYPESGASADQDTPMLELSDNNVSTSGADISGLETDSRSQSGTSMSSLVSCESQGSCRSYQLMS